MLTLERVEKCMRWPHFHEIEFVVEEALVLGHSLSSDTYKHPDTIMRTCGDLWEVVVVMIRL